MSKQHKIVTPSQEEMAAYGVGPASSRSDRQDAGPTTSQADSKSNPAESAVPDPETAATPRSEADDWRDKFLRSRAELANYQKRAEKERSEAMRYAHAELARALLPLVDDLDRLINSASEKNATLDALVQGVRLTRDNFLKVLQQFHVQPIDAQGQPFDPNVHEALMQQPSDKHDEPTVLQEVGRGYKLHDRVLRPAKVIVSRSLTASPQPSEPGV